MTGDEQATYRYILEYVEIIMIDVLKGAVLNSVVAAKRMSDGSPPPVRVLISGGIHDMCVKVSDLGGKMTRKEANTLSNCHQTATSS